MANRLTVYFLRTFLRTTMLVGLFLCLSRVAQAELPPPTAQDTASDAVYDDGWGTGDNGGFGMGGWVQYSTGSSGFLVGNSTSNNGAGGDSNNDGDINTSPGRAWGLFANGGTASAVRNFPLSSAFTPGSVFEIFMDNGDVQTNGRVGFELRTVAGAVLLEVYLKGGDTQYTVHGDSAIPSGVISTRKGVRVVITLTTASTYQATLTRLDDGASSTVSGNLRGPGLIGQLRLFNDNAGSGVDRYLFFNRITYYRGRVLNVDTGRGYLNIQPALDDPATLPGHTISVAAGLYTGTQNNNIVINKPRLTLIGAGPTATIISRTVGGSPSGIIIGNGITGTTISSLRVQGFINGGICAIQGNHFTTITNTHVYSNTAGGACYGGISLNGIGGGINHVTISHNEVVNNTSRGIVIWNGFKTNITITHNLVRNNNCCGIELQDGTASGVLIAHNLVRDNFDNGIAATGLTAGAGPNLIYSNTLFNNGRFGIEIKLPSGTGLPTGDGSIVVLSNTVALTDTIGDIKPGEDRDLAGIAAFRRSWVASENNADIPAGVIIQGNIVSGYQQPSDSDGFGIVVEGARMTVISNTLVNNDVGVQVQAGHTPYAPFTNTDGNQNNLPDQYFGRGNSPVACAFYQAGNVFTGNLTDTRQVGPPVTPGTVSNLNTFQTFCSIQSAIDAPPTQNGHILSLSGDPFTGTVVVTKSVVISGAGPGQTVIQSLSPGIVVTTSNVTISNTSIVGTGSDAGITTTFGVTNLTVSNVHISNFAQGVALLGGHSHTVQNSVFTLTNVITSVGVGMTGLTTTLPITNVLVSGNVFTSSGFAVVGVFADQNVITGNQMRFGKAGVRLAGANSNVIQGNQIEDNDFYAIYLAPNAPPLIPSVLSNSNNLISGNVALNHPNDRAIQIINSPQPGNGNQIVNNVIQNAGQEGIFIGAGSGDTNLLIAGNTVITANLGIFVGSSVTATITNNQVSGGSEGIRIANSSNVMVISNTVDGAALSLELQDSHQVVITGNTLINSGLGFSITNNAGNLVTATFNIITSTGGVLFNSGNASGLLLSRNNLANNAGITNTAASVLNAECNWYGASDGPSGVGGGSGTPVSTNVDFNPWLLSDDLNGPCSSGSLTIQKVLVGPITPTTAWQFTATVPTGTLVFTLPANGGAITFSGLDLGPTIITETTKRGYVATSSCTTGATGGASINFNLIGNVTCTFTNTIVPTTTVITVTPVITNGWFYITETVGSGSGLLPFDIVLPPPDPTLGAASARLTITNSQWRHMYAAPIFTGTLLSDITVFEYRLYVPTTSPQTPYINIGWDDNVTDGNTGFRGRLVYTPPSLPSGTWHTIDARNDQVRRWYNTLNVPPCTAAQPCTFTELVAAYPNAAIHPVVPLGFIGIRAGAGPDPTDTGTGYADGLRVGVGNQITLFDFEAAPPTTVTLTANPTTTVVGNNVLLTATVTIANGDPAADGTVVSFTTSLGNVSLVTATTVGGVVTATLNSTIAGAATVTATVNSLSATVLVTFVPGAPFSVTLTAVPSTLPVDNTSTLTATVRDQYGNSVADGTVVSFTTSPGNVSPITATTIGGVVTATLTSTTPGVATVTARSNSLSATVLVTFTPGAPFTLTLTAAPSTLTVGNASTLKATATDRYGNAVADGTTISFTTDLGTLSSGTASTSGGEASVTLNSTSAGVATVTATVNSLSATVLVTFTPGAPFTFTFTLTPTVIVANGISQSLATVAVVDQFNNPVSGVTVNFLAGIGSFSPTSGATDASGRVTATLTSLTPAIENVFAVVSGLGFRSAQATYVNPPASSAPLTATLQTVTQTVGVVRKGSLITYTVIVTNNGLGQVNNVLIYAPIPSGTTYVTGSASGGNFIGSFAMLLTGQELGEGTFGPQAALNAVAWSGNLPSGASHILSYVVQVQILEGKVVNQPKVFVDNADTGINLSSTVDVIANKYYMPIVWRAS